MNSEAHSTSRNLLSVFWEDQLQHSVMLLVLRCQGYLISNSIQTHILGAEAQLELVEQNGAPLMPVAEKMEEVGFMLSTLFI